MSRPAIGMMLHRLFGGVCPDGHYRAEGGYRLVMCLTAPRTALDHSCIAEPRLSGTVTRATRSASERAGEVQEHSVVIEAQVRQVR